MEKKIKRSVKTKSMFYNIFIGEYVDLVTRQTVEVAETSDGSTMTQKTPLIISGYVIDMDDEFIYVGPIPLGVSQAVLRSEVVIVTVSAPQEETLPVMSNEDKKNFN